MIQKLLILAMACMAMLITGCRALAPGGAYNGDQVLYNADLTIATSYDVVHSFVLWEYQNRAALSGAPQIKEYANSLRAQYPTWHKAALAARSAYAISKSSANSTALQQALDVLREAIRQANQWLVSNPNVSTLEVK